MNCGDMNAKFGLGGLVSFEPGPGGLTQALIRVAGHEARLMLHGAHLTHYQPAGERPVLWMSGQSQFAAGKPIRGGVPICFPWFGSNEEDATLPMHGFARLTEWEVIQTRQPNAGSVEITLAMRSGEATRKLWPHEFVLKSTVTVGAALNMALNVANIGRGDLTITEALHTYFSILDIHKVSVTGLADTDYIDKVAGGALARQGSEPIAFVGEIDRAYLDTTAACVLEDPRLGRRIVIGKKGSDSTVVWNPWIAKAARMPDFGDDEWPGMVCIETANAGRNAVTIKPGKSHTMQARIEVAALEAAKLT